MWKNVEKRRTLYNVKVVDSLDSQALLVID